MMARLLWYLDRSSPHQQNKPVAKVGPPLTKLSGSAQEQTTSLFPCELLAKIERTQSTAKQNDDLITQSLQK